MSKQELTQIIIGCGHTETNAVKLASAIYDAVNEAPSHIATKEDVANVKIEVAHVRTDMAVMKTDLIDRIGAIKTSMGQWIALSTTIISFVLVLVKYIK